MNKRHGTFRLRLPVFRATASTWRATVCV